MVAQHCGFEQRNRGKIKAHRLISAFMLMLIEGNKSYWAWACALATEIGKAVSKQAIFSRMTQAWVATVRALLQEVLLQQAGKGVQRCLFARFGNVWLQDSTTLHLPEIMLEKFKGNVSKGAKKSVAKLNVILNVLNGFCPVMEWTSFTINEQRLSPSILNTARAGDLVIRDLGYFAFDVFRQMQERGIYFLSRCRYGVCFQEVSSGKTIPLLKLLNGKTKLDCRVCCGEQKLQLRLVAIKLTEAQAAQRRRKAKQDRDKRLHHSKAYYKLLGYVLFLTNVEDTVWNYRQVAEAYRVRWNIEILFKSWKSGFHIEQLIPQAHTNTERVESILYLMLLYIAWFHLLIFVPLQESMREQGKHLSILKVAKLIKGNLLHWRDGELSKKLKKEITYYCCYDTRHDRINMAMRLEQFYSFLT